MCSQEQMRRIAVLRFHPLCVRSVQYVWNLDGHTDHTMLNTVIGLIFLWSHAALLKPRFVYMLMISLFSPPSTGLYKNEEKKIPDLLSFLFFPASPTSPPSISILMNFHTLLISKLNTCICYQHQKRCLVKVRVLPTGANHEWAATPRARQAPILYFQAEPFSPPPPLQSPAVQSGEET